MLTKAQSKYIRSLSQQKYRKEYNQFIAEGNKIAQEWLAADTNISKVLATEKWLQENDHLLAEHEGAEVITVLPHELENISSLKTPNEVLLVVDKPEEHHFEAVEGWVLALDTIQDPGNMGTIIRIADWFGIKRLILSEGCVDIYNPKVVQSTMGSHTRVKVYYESISSAINNSDAPVYAAVLGGENLFELKEKKPGFIIIGNESKGISDELQALATHKVTIPGKGSAESLNAGVSTGIICALLTAS